MAKTTPVVVATATPAPGADSFCRLLRARRVVWACAESKAAAVIVAKRAARSEHADVGAVLFPEEMGSCDCLELRVPLFTKAQVGTAAELGPVSLGAVVRFCEALRGALQGAGEQVVCVACSSKPGKAANSLLLVGAYLVLELGVPALDAGRALLAAEGGRAPPQRFPRPWSHCADLTRDSLTTQDVLLGLEVAVAHGWLDYHHFDVRMRHQVATDFDAVPVFGVHLKPASPSAPKVKLEDSAVRVGFWIAADPVTTVEDPEPRPDPLLDFKPTASGDSADREEENKENYPKWVAGSSVRRSNRSSNSDSHGGFPGVGSVFQRVFSKASRRSDLQHFDGGDLRMIISNRRSICTTEEVMCAVLDHSPSSEWSTRGRRQISKTKSGASKTNTPILKVEQTAPQRPKDLPAFARWLKEDLGCKLLVRCNFGNERGLPGGSYDDFFQRWGVDQVEMPFPDMTAPSFGHMQALICEVTQVLQRLQEESREGDSFAVMVHCKAGMGRSMSALAALAVALNPGLSAAAFFGWARLARPGSVQTAEQERFIRSLDEEVVRCRCFGHWRGKDSVPTGTPGSWLSEEAAKNVVCSAQ